jgi:hypothetical protein
LEEADDLAKSTYTDVQASLPRNYRDGQILISIAPIGLGTMGKKIYHFRASFMPAFNSFALE